jgi:programmed cell death protein 5
MNNLTPEQMEQLQEFEKVKKVVMNKILSKDALERLGRIRLVKPEMAMQLEVYLMQLYQSGQIKTMIDDSKLRQILDSLTDKKGFKILR